jgi:hypothetical protein
MKMSINYNIDGREAEHQAKFYPKYELVGFADLHSKYGMPVWRKKYVETNKYSKVTCYD